MTAVASGKPRYRPIAAGMVPCHVFDAYERRHTPRGGRNSASRPPCNSGGWCWESSDGHEIDLWFCNRQGAWFHAIEPSPRDRDRWHGRTGGAVVIAGRINLVGLTTPDGDRFVLLRRHFKSGASVYAIESGWWGGTRSWTFTASQQADLAAWSAGLIPRPAWWDGMSDPG